MISVVTTRFNNATLEANYAYRQKKEFEHLGVETITLEQYNKEKQGSSKTYLFDHLSLPPALDGEECAWLCCIVGIERGLWQPDLWKSWMVCLRLSSRSPASGTLH